MIGLPTARWVASMLLRQPSFWAIASALAGLWVAVAALTPFGLTTSARTVPGILYEVAFMALILSHVLALTLVGRIGWLVKPLPLLRRAGLDLVASTTAALLLLAAAIALPVSMGVPAPELSALLLAHVHLLVIALLLGQLPITDRARACGLPLVAWILPATCADLPGLGPTLARVLDAASHLRLAQTPQPFSPWAMLPLVGIGLAAWLLEPPVGQTAVREAPQRRAR